MHLDAYFHRIKTNPNHFPQSRIMKLLLKDFLLWLFMKLKIKK